MCDRCKKDVVVTYCRKCVTWWDGKPDMCETCKSSDAHPYSPMEHYVYLEDYHELEQELARTRKKLDFEIRADEYHTKQWWDCLDCNGTGSYGVDMGDILIVKICTYCTGTGKRRVK